MIWIALIGLLVNLVVARLLMGRGDNQNVRAALLHVIGDLLGSVAALVSGVVILFYTSVGGYLAVVWTSLRKLSKRVSTSSRRFSRAAAI